MDLQEAIPASAPWSVLAFFATLNKHLPYFFLPSLNHILQPPIPAVAALLDRAFSETIAKHSS